MGCDVGSGIGWGSGTPHTLAVRPGRERVRRGFRDGCVCVCSVPPSVPPHAEVHIDPSASPA